MPTTKKQPAAFEPGDLVDLEGRDQTPANATIWSDEFAEVESVSTVDKRSGGWCDALLDDRANRNLAIVYTTNGTEPSVILAARWYSVDHPAVPPVDV